MSVTFCEHTTRGTNDMFFEFNTSVWAPIFGAVQFFFQLEFYKPTLTSSEGQKGGNISIESDFHFLG